MQVTGSLENCSIVETAGVNNLDARADLSVMPMRQHLGFPLFSGANFECQGTKGPQQKQDSNIDNNG